MKRLRLAIMLNLAPRKLGSLEAWLVALAAECRRRGHRMHAFGHAPLHPTIAERFSELEVGWSTIAELERHPGKAALRIARAFDVVQLNLFAPRSRVALLSYAAWPARVIFVNHHSVLDPSGLRSSAIRRVVDHWSMARVARFAAVSDFVRGWSTARYGLDPAIVRTIHNGVDVQRFHPPEDGRQDGVVRIMASAHLRPDKGVHHLLEAFQALDAPAARLLIAGDGPEEPRLRALAASLGIEGRMEFLGLRDDVPALLRTADLFVHPVVSLEAFGLAVAEAMASGCAVVASRIGGIPEIIEDGVSGLLVRAGDVGELTAALGRLVNDASQRACLGAAARRRIVERFSLERCVAAHLDLCEEVASRGHRGR